MPARVIIRKYTGKDGDFGTEVSSIGLKRIDTCVPSVYSSASLEGTGKTIPADDASDARMYCIYRPETADCHAYSMESVFKIHLIEKPDVQLSNIRIYPVGERPRSPHQAVLNIGNSVSYSKPTDQKSIIAVNNIWNYSKEHPFYLTVSGVYGQVPDPQLGKTDYTVKYKDFGYGNVICLDGVRQLIVPVATRTDSTADISVTFKDHTFMHNDPDYTCIEFRKAEVNPTAPAMLVPGDLIDEKFIERDRVTEADGGTYTYLKLKVKSEDGNLMQECPNGLFYKIPGDDHGPNYSTGHQVVWVDLYGSEPALGNPSYVPNRWFTQTDDQNGHIIETPTEQPYTKPVERFEVEVLPDELGHLCYYVNGVRRPHLHFDLRNFYHFKNHSGAQFPLRFIGNPHSHMANSIDDVVTEGVIVINGGTNDEEIMVNPEAVLKAGRKINAYQCVCQPALGSYVYNHQFSLCGNYNMCRVNGGIYNPLMAGETDYVYLQLDVAGDTDPGYCVPDIMIEYDEN